MNNISGIRSPLQGLSVFRIQNPKVLPWANTVRTVGAFECLHPTTAPGSDRVIPPYRIPTGRAVSFYGNASRSDRVISLSNAPKGHAVSFCGNASRSDRVIPPYRIPTVHAVSFCGNASRSDCVIPFSNAPKGHPMSAQGNALGLGTAQCQSPVGATYTASPAST